MADKESMPGLALIMGRANGRPHDSRLDNDDGEEEKDEPPDVDHKQAIKDASDEAFDAVSKGDKDRFHMALKSMMDIHKHAPEEESDEDPDGDDDDEDEPADHGRGLRV